MQIDGTHIADTFAEAFPMAATRVVVTAESLVWARVAGQAATGYAASVIGCDAEAGIEAELAPDATPDGRPGVSLLLFAFSRDALQKALVNRVAQCVLTCATTACYAGLPRGDRAVRVGGNLRYFADGWQVSKLHGDRRYWRLPTMDGEFLCEDEFGTVKGVAGGNLIALGESQAVALAAAERAVAACRSVPGVIAPFPGGVVRSGSKVGSRYKALKASTNEAYSPTLRAAVPTSLPPGANAAYEVVLDALDLPSMQEAMRRGVRAACGPGVVEVAAGNYGGKLGPVLLHLRQLLGEGA